MKFLHRFFTTFEKTTAQIVQQFYRKKTQATILGIGVILRIAQFFYNRSLTEGEAPLAMNIIQRSYSELLKPLDNVQAAPVGFLMIQKFATNILGNSEYALRLFPLIAGVISLGLFYKVAKDIIEKNAIPFALILFATGDHLIYFASEVKQYSSDVAITLLLILLIITTIKKDLNTKYILMFGIIGAFSTWLSHPAIFILGAGSIVLVITIIHRQKWQALVWWCIASITILVGLIANYIVSLKDLSSHRDLLEFWQHAFMPFPPTSVADLKWYGYVFLRTFKFPVGLSIYELGLAVVTFLYGLLFMLSKKKMLLLTLILPICFTLIASGLRKYPFEGRLLLFITPCLVLIIAEGLSYMYRKIANTSHILGSVIVCLLLVYPVCLAGYRLIRPRAPEELRPVLQYVRENNQQGDILYVYYASLNAFKYYAYRTDYTGDYVIGIESRDDWAQYYNDLQKLMGIKRVWIIFSHIATHHGVNEEKLFLSYLDILGTQQDAFKTSGASAYLYDMACKLSNF